LIEFLAGFGVIAYGIMAVSLGVRYLKVVDHTEEFVDVSDSTEVEAFSA